MSRSGNNPVIPPRPDSMPNAGRDQSSMGRPPPPPERTHSQSKTPVQKDLPPVPPPVPPHPDEWGESEKEEIRVRELEEARARAAQMEKTMRWWSDCTANWREKWSKVRNERNKVREECRQLRSRLETSMKEHNSVKRDRDNMSSEMTRLKKVVEQYQSADPSKVTNNKDKVKIAGDVSVCSSESHKSSDQDLQATLTNTEDTKADCNLAAPPVVNQEDFLLKLLSRKEKELDSSSSSHSDRSDKAHCKPGSVSSKQASCETPVEDVVFQRLSMLQLKLDEAQKTISLEREEKSELGKSIQTLERNILVLTKTKEEVQESHDKALNQLTEVQSAHETQVDRMTSEIEDESTRSDSMDRRLAELRKELERLQEENAQEWGKRERLETEKQSLERENKKIKKELETVEEELARKNQQTTALLDSDLKAVQLEITEKTREMSEVRHHHSKLKKVLAEKSSELEHAKSRAEQYELEVKKLRARIDELKRELGVAEDEADQQAHQVRKSQRHNDELQQQVENLTVQVQHLQTRLMRAQPMSGTRAASLKSYDTNDSTTEGMTDEDADD